MDIQAIFNAVSEAARDTRSDYQMTLGKLIAELSEQQPGASVALADGTGVEPESLHSYRGYYSDLAISARPEPTTCGELLEALRDALGKEFTGYKGGENLMGEDAPLWLSEYGVNSGLAIMELVPSADGLTLVTKQVD